MAFTVLASRQSFGLACRKPATKPRPAGLGKVPSLTRTPARLPQTAVEERPSRGVSCNAAVAAASVSFGSGAFAACTAYAAALYSMMLVAPITRKIQQVLKSNLIFVPLALAYGALLARAWSPDQFSLLFPGDISTGLATGKTQFFPKLTGIMELFSRQLTVPSFWAHIMAINVFCARHVVLDGIEKRVPTLHSILLTAVFGPVGFLSHQITKAVAGGARALAGPDAGAVKIPTDMGTIILLPY